jgi:hypothetical protein
MLGALDWLMPSFFRLINMDVPNSKEEEAETCYRSICAKDVSINYDIFMVHWMSHECEWQINNLIAEILKNINKSIKNYFEIQKTPPKKSINPVSGKTQFNNLKMMIYQIFCCTQANTQQGNST